MNDESLSHTDGSGRARMVDISGKDASARYARASGAIRMASSTLDAIRGNALKKGDVLSVARIAGIMAAKKTAETIPLCHPIALTDVGVEFTLDDSLPGVRVVSHARTLERTGVEMEALTAATAALLTIYDMAKGLDRGMTIVDVALLEKSGGASGDWKRDDTEG
ncbi:MAG TPA: cyclic pyranopterin monophosphate synthase MoaC [Gemmatimonadaceae bacterium]|nr:cyclic pyranopterin monophosphate synthase MoaC [Gemmatimonadaceae bacterium]